MYRSFAKYIRADGLSAPVEIPTGRIVRFPGEGKPPTDRSAWALLFEGGCAGVYGDWSTGKKRRWRDERLGWKDKNSISKTGEVRRVRMQEGQQDRSAHDRAAKTAKALMERSIPARPDFPYLLRKRIAVYSARMLDGQLVLPIQTLDGELTSIQFIRRDGRKRLLKHGRKKGCVVRVCDAGELTRIVICEGWATGATIAKYEPHACILAAIDAGNLREVAVGARRRWPDTELIIAGDDDRVKCVNTGFVAANDAARASGALVAFPDWPIEAPLTLTDFNDLDVWLTDKGDEPC